MDEISIKGSITPVNAIRIIQLPWWLGTSFCKIMPRLKENTARRYSMYSKKQEHYFPTCSTLRRQIDYPQFYR